jgi:FkbM family methyltransferase
MKASSTIVEMVENGHRYRINNPGGHIGGPIGRGEPYERKLLNFVFQQGLAGSALDVGAHVGNHTLYFAAVCGLKVHAFEPDLDTYTKLVENINLNPELHDRIQTYQCALGVEAGRAGINHKMQVVEGDSVRVEAADWLLPSMPDLALVKIDVEGYEPEVLMGMIGHLERSRPLLLTEVHTDEALLDQRVILLGLDYHFDHWLKMGSRMAVWRG